MDRNIDPTYKIGLFYVLYPASETYMGRRQWEVESLGGKRGYMTAAEINDSVSGECNHERTYRDAILQVERCADCGRILVEKESPDAFSTE